MELLAYKVLEDCKNAHILLEMEEYDNTFRLYWVAGVTLLRAVGHVLKEVDRKKGRVVKAAIDQKLAEWEHDKETHAIFWEFIKKERDNVLKEYDMGFLSSPISIINKPDDEEIVLGENLFCPISDGRYAGEDCRNILAKGISWWEVQLTDIERLISR